MVGVTVRFAFPGPSPNFLRIAFPVRFRLFEVSDAHTYIRSVCQRLKQLGYSPTHHIKQYGEEFEVISDPFADGNRFVVRVGSETRKTERLLTIPRNVIEAAKYRTNV